MSRAGDWPVIWLNAVDSTNLEAGRRACAQPFVNCWIAAHRQTAGRGRRSRTWVSLAGNLHATALYAHDGPLADVRMLPFAAGLAVLDVVDTFTPAPVASLKWPNDIRIEGQKIAGILIESGAAGKGYWIAVGIGINVAHAPEGTGQAVTCLSACTGRPDISVQTVLDLLRETLGDRLQQLASGFEGVRSDWLARAEGLGQRIRVRQGQDHLEGRFETIGADGTLILQLPDGSRRTISSGRVELTERKR